MPGTPSRLRRLASFLARLLRVGSGSSHEEPSNPTLEERLDVALARDDFDAAARLVIEALGPQVLRCLRALTYDEEQAKEVFTAFADDLWKNIPTWRRAVSLRSWTYGLAWQAARRVQGDPHRHRREWMEEAGPAHLAESMAAAAGPSKQRRDAALARLRAALKPEDRALLVLRLDHQLSWREVAEVLAEDGWLPREAEVRHRFDKLKKRLRGSPGTRAEAAPYGQLAVAEVARLVGDAGARLFDLRPPQAYARGHLPGAVRTAPGDVVRSLPADRALHLVYYGENTRDPTCHGAARAAAQAGYPNVFIMPAGIEGWRAAGKRVEMES